MFASLLVYQLIDLLVALALAALAARATAGLARRLQARFPSPLATPFRRFALVAVPAFAIVLLGFAAIGRLWLFPWIAAALRGHPELQRVSTRWEAEAEAKKS